MAPRGIPRVPAVPAVPQLHFGFIKQIEGPEDSSRRTTFRSERRDRGRPALYFGGARHPWQHCYHYTIKIHSTHSSIHWRGHSRAIHLASH